MKVQVQFSDASYTDGTITLAQGDREVEFVINREEEEPYQFTLYVSDAREVLEALALVVTTIERG